MTMINLTPEQQTRYNQLATLDANGLLETYANQEDMNWYRVMKNGESPAAPVAPAFVSPAPQAADSIQWETWEMNSAKFDEGWGSNWVSPKEDGIYAGVYKGTYVPERNPDQRHFIVESLPGVPDTEYFRGALVIANLNNTDNTNSAGKAKDTLAALGLQYQITGPWNVRVESRVDILCKVEYRTVDVRGKMERRVQNILAAQAETL